MNLVTLDEAATRLDPPISTSEVRNLVRIFAVKPAKSESVGIGRPRHLYDMRRIEAVWSIVKAIRSYQL